MALRLGPCLLLGAVTAGCSAAPAPSPAPSATAAPPAASSPDFRRSLDTEVEELRDQMAFAPSGELLVVSGEQLQVRDAATGELRRSAPACRPVGPFAFARPDRLVVPCFRDITVFTWPGLVVRSRIPVRETLWRFAVGPDRIAYAGSTLRRVRVSAIDDATVRDWFDVDERVAGLAFSPDGGLLAVTTDGGVHLRDVARRAGRALIAEPASHRSGGAAFSPDGSRFLFGSRGHATEVAVRDGAAMRAFSEVGWLSAAAYLPDGSAVGVTPQGLHLYTGAGGQPVLLERDVETSLAVSADGQRVCAALRERLICFASAHGGAARSRAVRPVPLAAGPAPPETRDPGLGPAPPAAPAGYEVAFRFPTPGPFPADALAIAPGGELVVFFADRFEIHDKDRGSLLHQGMLCFPRPGGLSFLGTDRLLVRCAGAVRVLGWPTMAELAVVAVPGCDPSWRLRAGLLLCAEEQGALRLLSTDTGKAVETIPIQRTVSGATLGEGGRLIAWADAGGLWVRDRDKKATRAVSAATGHAHLALSADGQRLFSVVDEIARETDVASGGQRRAWKVSRGAHSPSYLPGGDVLAIVDGGLAILDGPGGDAPRGTPVGRPIAIAEDASRICAQDNREVVCFRRTRGP